MLAHEAPEPLAQEARLAGNLVQFAGRRLVDQCIERIRWNQPRLSEPPDETIAAVEPVNRRIDGSRDGIQEIEPERVGDEKRRRPVWHENPSNQANNPTI
jgi:hypothetical protein